MGYIVGIIMTFYKVQNYTILMNNQSLCSLISPETDSSLALHAGTLKINL